MDDRDDLIEWEDIPRQYDRLRRERRNATQKRGEVEADLAAARAALERIVHHPEENHLQYAYDTLLLMGTGEALAAVRKAQRTLELHGFDGIAGQLKTIFGEAE